jgi:hypothetical protein
MPQCRWSVCGSCWVTAAWRSPGVTPDSAIKPESKNILGPWTVSSKESAMKMINVIVDFRRYLKRRNYSPHTVKYCLNVIKQFVLWLSVPLEQVSVKQIEDYIDCLHQKTHAAGFHQFIFGHHPGVLQLP